MKRCISFVIFWVFVFSALAQEDEHFVNSIYKDLIATNCDSFLLITAKDRLEITAYIESELNKVLPKKAVKEMIISSQESDRNWEWDTTILLHALPISYNEKHVKERELIDDVNEASQALLLHFGLDTTGDYTISDSLQNAIMESGLNVYNFSKVPACKRQMYRFSRPLFENKQKYAIIAFTNHKWPLNASGFIAIYKKKKGCWIRIAEVNHWVS